MWSKIKAAGVHLLSHLWTYATGFVGTILSTIDSIGDLLGDPTLKEQIKSVIGDPQTVGKIFLAFSVIALFKKARDMRMKNKDDNNSGENKT